MPLTPEQERKLLQDTDHYNMPQNEYLRQVSELPQDQAIKILRLSTLAGVDLNTAAENPNATIQQLIGAKDFEDVGKFAPATYSFLNNPVNMAATQTKANTFTLANLENGWNITKALKNGVKNLVQSDLGVRIGFVEGMKDSADKVETSAAPFQRWALQQAKMLSALGPLTSDSVSVEGAKQLRDSKLLQRQEVKADSKLGQYGYDIAEQSPQWAAQLAIAAMTGGGSLGATAATAFMGSQIIGSQYTKQRKEGVSPDRALAASVVDAAAQAPFERLSLSKMFKRLPAGSSSTLKARELLEKALTEGATEWIQQYPEALTEIWAKNPEMNADQRGEEFYSQFEDITKEGMYQGLVALPFGGIGGAMHLSAQKKLAEISVRQMEEQQRNIAQSNLDPSVVERHLEMVTEGEKVFIDPEALVMYQRENPNAIDELGLTEEKVAESLQTGQMVEVPYSKYQVKAVEHPDLHEALKDDISLDETGYTKRRLEGKNTKDVLAATMESQAMRRDVNDHAQEVYKSMIEAGVPAEQAKLMRLALVKNAYAYGADNPAQWLKEKAPQFRKGDTIASGAMAQPLNLDVDLSSKVNVVDVSRAIPKGKFINQQELLNHLMGLAKQNPQLSTADNKAIMEVLPRGSRHVVYSKSQYIGDHGARRASVLSIADLIKSSVLIESAENTKQSQKPNVQRYHYFYVPISMNGKNFTIKIVGEEMKGVITVNPTGIELYDVVVEKKKSSPAGGTNPQDANSPLKAAKKASTITIKEMLDGVKDSNGNPYYQTNDGVVDARGSIKWEDGRAIVTLFETADPSTLIHEVVGHFFFQNLIEEGAKDDAAEWMQRDRKTALEWAGVENWYSLTPEQKVEVHEKFSRAAETYIMEGKAPSIEMRGMFAKFKAWLTEIYREIRALDVEMTPEIRGVFDRMLASEHEIQQMEIAGEYYAKLPRNMVDSLTEAQKAQLDRIILKARETTESNLRGALMQYISADNQFNIREERQRATERLAEQVNAEPLYRAMDLIVGEYRRDAKRVATSYKNGKLSEDQEVHFDWLAETHGYSSGDEMASRILEAKEKEAEIAARVEQHIESVFQDILKNPEAVKAEAIAAMYNDDGATLLAAQLHLINEKLAEMTDPSRKATMEAARQETAMLREHARIAAESTMAAKPIEAAIRLQTWVSARVRAAEKASKAMTKGDMATAKEWKEIELYNAAMAQESLRIKREYERINKYLNKQRKSDRKTWIDEDFFHQAADILQRFGFMRKDYNGGTETLAEWVRRQDDIANESEVESLVAIADWLLNPSYSRDIKQLTIEQAQDVENAIRNIKTVARLGVNSDNFAVINEYGKEETVVQLLDKASVVKDAQVDQIEKSRGKFLAEFRAGLKQAHRLFENMDGFKSFGLWTKTMYESVKLAQDTESGLLRRVAERMEAAYTAEGISKPDRYRMAHKKIYIAEWEQSVTKNTLLAIALNMGSQSNLERLEGTRLVGVAEHITWDAASIKAVLQKHLTAADFRLVGKLWQAVDVYTEYNATVKKMAGFSLPKVEAVPIAFTTNSGETVHLAGGYYPLSQDWRGSKQAELNAEKKLGEAMGRMPYPSTGRSKSRQKGAQYAVDVDLANLYGNMAEIIHDIAFRPVAYDLNKLMRDSRIKDVMRRKLGDAQYQAIVEWQKRVTTGKTEGKKDFMDKGLNAIRSATVISSLLLRPGVAFQNLANFTLYGNSVDGFGNQDALTAYLKHGWNDYIPAALANTARAKELRQFVYERSEMMRDKKENPDFTLREMHGNANEDWVVQHTGGLTQDAAIKVATTREAVVNFASDVFAFTDQLTDVPMWIGAYGKALEMGKTEREAVNFADAVIRNSTGSGRLIDTSGAQATNNAALKTMTMFMTFLNTAYNRWAAEKGVQLQERDVTRLLKFAAVQYVAFGALSAALSFKFPKDDEEWWKWFVKEVLAWPVGMIPIGRDLAKLAIDQALGNKTYGYKLSPVESKIEDVAKLLKVTGDVWDGKKQGGDLVEPALNVASFVARYPDQINDWLMNAYDIAVGNIQPQLLDLVKRRPKKERD